MEFLYNIFFSEWISKVLLNIILYIRYIYIYILYQYTIYQDILYRYTSILYILYRYTMIYIYIYTPHIYYTVLNSIVNYTLYTTVQYMFCI